MIRTVASFGTTMARGYIELLLFSPPFLLLTVYALPESADRWLWLATLPLCHLAGYGLGRIGFLWKLLRLPLLLCLVCIALLHSYIWMGGTPLFQYVWLAGLLFSYRGARTVVVPWTEYFPAGYYVVGTILYFVTSILLRFVPSFIPSFAPYEPLLVWGGIPSLALTLLMVNQAYLKQETLSGKKNTPLAASVAWQNRVLTIILFTVAILIAVFRQLQQAVLWLKEKLLGGFNLGTPLQFQLTLQDVPKPPPVSRMPAEAKEDPSQWWVWIEKAALIFFYIFMSAIVIFVLYRIVRMIIAWIRHSYKWLIEFLQQGDRKDTGVGYEDDIETIVDWSAFRNVFASRFRNMFKGGPKELRWEDLQNNRERARYLYRAMLTAGLKSGYKSKPYLTPKETGQELERWEKKPSLTPQPIVSAYERVRYGDKDVSDEEVAAAKQALERQAKG